ncbi:uncharacterized protein DC041_0001473, partial [Schistosoma bovis]
MHKNKNVEKSVKCKQSNKCSNLKICHHHHRDQDQDQDQDHHHHHHHCGYCHQNMHLIYFVVVQVSTALLIKDFLNYDVSVHTQLIMDNPSPFPSLTVSSTIWSYDSLSVYYQNLNYKESLNLGHNLTIFLNCMRIYSHMSVFEDNCTLLNGYHIKRLSHHQYLNCYTFEPININAANETTFLSLIV